MTKATQVDKKNLVALLGIEPRHPDSKSDVLDHYTIGLPGWRRIKYDIRITDEVTRVTLLVLHSEYWFYDARVQAPSTMAARQHLDDMLRSSDWNVVITPATTTSISHFVSGRHLSSCVSFRRACQMDE